MRQANASSHRIGFAANYDQVDVIWHEAVRPHPKIGTTCVVSK